ncbi:flavin monoamine oxidase family protein [Salinarimonas soli]|uniref:NAD(P)-binding protein n=1 Tax=Salinarimonas soli TaxID=1638099 RepID=A0A5B2VZ29_9HYPH|nr:FAD-dependent oxidoreductase [Salinarimonas soli]KAA2244044.1 NAD(P)-binding protein [Salinarimonas soli]
MSHPVLIVGGGLAGLTAAHRLHQAGVPFRLLEARERLGGRILSVDASGRAAADGFDLGPSWFWPGTQPALNALVNELGLQAFPQNSEGEIVVHRMSREAPQRYQLTAQPEAQSMRLAGGSGALVAALAAGLPAENIRLGARVTHLTRAADGVEARFATESRSQETVRASHVLLAVPPRLLAADVTFSPALDAATQDLWRSTPTWMAPHAKVFALYDKPFWREAGLSGTAQSMAGPLVEIHDATTVSGRAALFGFLGVPAERRAALGEEALVAAAIQQLVRLFGVQAASPIGTLYKDWSADPLTATQADGFAGGPPMASARSWIDAEWCDRVTLAGSETADVEPGYLAGAVDAAERAVSAMAGLRRMAARRG